jgi:murein DD-endopeptidase MepM/ murein hydrolase activator NlpD
VVTRYAHLLGIAPGVALGTVVQAGQFIAFVGESGTPESLSNPGTEYHLHFEVRVGDSYLGKGLSAAEVRRLYERLFEE